MVVFFLALLKLSYSDAQQWLNNSIEFETVEERISPPDGFTRLQANSTSFTNWLRALPLKPPGTPVYLYDRTRKLNQSVQIAVIDIDTGSKDLQQCADAVMRLRAEFLYSQGRHNEIAFNFTSGDRASFDDWKNGIRLKVEGNEVTRVQTSTVDSSYVSFREYLDSVFMYAGTYSLTRELKTKSDWCAINPGDVIIQGGFPGHAVIVIDVAINESTGERLFLLAQGFTPAQDIHILKNPMSLRLSPWYACVFSGRLRTPEWTFTRDDLMSFE